MTGGRAVTSPNFNNSPRPPWDLKATSPVARILRPEGGSRAALTRDTLSTSTRKQFKPRSQAKTRIGKERRINSSSRAVSFSQEASNLEVFVLTRGRRGVRGDDRLLPRRVCWFCRTATSFIVLKTFSSKFLNYRRLSK